MHVSDVCHAMQDAPFSTTTHMSCCAEIPDKTVPLTPPAFGFSKVDFRFGAIPNYRSTRQAVKDWRRVAHKPPERANGHTHGKKLHVMHAIGHTRGKKLYVMLGRLAFE